MSLHLQDLDAILERARRVNTCRFAGRYADLSALASVVREDVPALVELARAEARRVDEALAELAQVVEERDRLKEALASIALVDHEDYCNVTLPCPACLASRALEGGT